MTIAVILALVGPARADRARKLPTIVIVPAECARWTIPGGTPAPWDALLSFAACIQDASVARIDHEEQLAGFVDVLETALDPALQLYMTAVEQAPDRVKLRAVYAVGLGQVALMTRARSSIASPALRAPLDALLEPHAELAYVIFATIDRIVAREPDLANDVVLRNIVHSARELAPSLRTRWPARNDDRHLQVLSR